MGMLSAFIGGAAATSEKMLDQDRQERIKMDEYDRQQQVALERQKQLAQFNAQLELTKQQELEKIKVKLDEDRRKAKVQALMDEDKKMAEVLPGIKAEREAGLLKKAQVVAPSMDANVMAQVKGLLTDDQIEQYYKVKAPTKVDDADDLIKAAQKVGAYESLPQLKDDRKTAVTQVEGDRKDTRENRRLDQQAERDDRNAANQNRALSNAERRTDILEARAEAAALKGNEPVEKLTTTLNTLNASIKNMEDSGDAKKDPDTYNALKKQRSRVVGLMDSKLDKKDSPSPADPAKTPAPKVARKVFDPATGTFKDVK